MTDGSSKSNDRVSRVTASENDLLAETVANALGSLEPSSADLLVKAAKEGTLEQKLKKSQLDALAEQLIHAELDERP